MPYNPTSIIESYERNAEIEDEAEKGPSLRMEIPREFIVGRPHRLVAGRDRRDNIGNLCRRA